MKETQKYKKKQLAAKKDCPGEQYQFNNLVIFVSLKN